MTNTPDPTVAVANCDCLCTTILEQSQKADIHVPARSFDDHLCQILAFW